MCVQVTKTANRFEISSLLEKILLKQVRWCLTFVGLYIFQYCNSVADKTIIIFQENFILGASNDFASRVWSITDMRLRVSTILLTKFDIPTMGLLIIKLPNVQ